MTLTFSARGTTRKTYTRYQPWFNFLGTLVLEAIGCEWLEVAKCGRLGHSVREKPTCHRPECKTVMGVAECEPQAGMPGRSADDRQHIWQTRAGAAPGLGIKASPERHELARNLFGSVELPGI